MKTKRATKFEPMLLQVSVSLVSVFLSLPASAANRCELPFLERTAESVLASNAKELKRVVIADAEAAAQHLSSFLQSAYTAPDSIARETLLDLFETKLNELRTVHGPTLDTRVRELVKQKQKAVAEELEKEKQEEAQTRRDQADLGERWTKFEIHEFPGRSAGGFQILDDKTMLLSLSGAETYLYNYQEKKLGDRILPRGRHEHGAHLVTDNPSKRYALFLSTNLAETIDLVTGERHFHQARPKKQGYFRQNAISPDGRFLALGGQGELRILSLPDLRPVFQDLSVSQEVDNLVFDSSSKFVLGFAGGPVLVDLSTKPAKKIELDVTDGVGVSGHPSPAYSKKYGVFYMIGQVDGDSRRIVEIDPGAKTLSPSHIALKARTLGVSADGEDLVLLNDSTKSNTSDHKPITVVQIATGSEVPLILQPRELIFPDKIVSSPDGRYAVIRQPGDRPVVVLNMIHFGFGSAPKNVRDIDRLSFSSDNQRLFGIWRPAVIGGETVMVEYK